ncbi:MAG: hypothetical protein CMF48_00320 [Legionellales bacterium]|nr:hypothetical protein [Legionellales bacterium]|tara:strand:+ start:211 stop:702 length:492 start_codon:yes stop_codon:yes gene_type:complete
MNTKFQKYSAAVALVCFSIVLVTLVMQFSFDLIPCSLCYIQRYLLLGIGIVSVLATLPIMSRRMQRVWAACAFIITSLGLATSIHHLRLQMLPPDQVPNCLPSADYLLANFPILEALEMILKGDHSCANPGWIFLGISLAGWAGIVFAAIFMNYTYWLLKGLR